MKGLSRKQIDKVRFLISKWEEKLTWEKLVKSIESDLGFRISRQALNGYSAIKDEYRLKKIDLRASTQSQRIIRTESDVQSEKKIFELERKLKVLERDKFAQLQLIETILANARELNIQFPAKLLQKR